MLLLASSALEDGVKANPSVVILTSSGGASAMMTRSAFTDADLEGSPYSPARIPTRVYASVAEMKRSRGKVCIQHNHQNCHTILALLQVIFM